MYTRRWIGAFAVTLRHGILPSLIPTFTMKNPDGDTSICCPETKQLEQSIALSHASNALSIDILAEIFAYLAPAYQTLGLNWRVRTSEKALETLAHLPLLAVSRVCRRWRRAALEMPWLWSTIEVDFDQLPVDRESSRALCFLLNFCLVRSAALPLILHARIASPNLYPEPLALLKASSSRWRVVNIDVAHPESAGYWQSGLLDGPFPLLERLHVRPRYNFPVDLTKAPRLAEVFTTFLPEQPLRIIPITPPTRIIPHEQLETIYISSGKSECIHAWPTHIIWSLRQLALSTKPLHLAVSFQIPYDGRIHVPYFTSTLVELHLTVWNQWSSDLVHCGAILDRALSRLALPALTSLSFASPVSDPQRRPLCISPVVFCDFIERNSLLGQKLTRFALVNIALYEPSTNASTKTWMALLPQLTHLTLSDMQAPVVGGNSPLPASHSIVFTDEFFQHLTTHLPRLVSLTGYTFMGRSSSRLTRALSRLYASGGNSGENSGSC
ncbi:hypothetical protein C8F01DRAFT_1228811 [Mycena amicta]|nr:hypothetical protein C8F01DRAFT_1228811 [Mycena amicta]